MSAPEFVETVEAIQGADLTEQPLEVWDALFRSCSTLMIRFALKLELMVIRLHPLFGRLLEIKHERIRLFARAQSLGPDGEGACKSQREWAWNEGEFAKMSERRYERMDLVSHSTGFVGVQSLKEATPIAPVPKHQYYRVESVVEGARDFFHATCVQAGYAHQPDKGLSAYDYFSLHADNLRWARSQGDRFAAPLIDFLVKLFVEGLELAGTLARAKDESTNPADITFDAFLPSQCPYVRLVAERKEQMAPLRLLREAFPAWMSSATPRLLPGVTAERGLPKRPDGHAPWNAFTSRDRRAHPANQRKQQMKAQAGGNQVRPSSKPTAPKHPAPKKPQSDAGVARPGSLAHLAKELPKGELLIAGTVFDVPAVAAHFGVSVADKCWPTLLSSKRGDGALALCPHHADAEHAGMGCARHQRPDGWNLKYIIEKFSRKPTATERPGYGQDSKAATPKKRPPSKPARPKPAKSQRKR